MGSPLGPLLTNIMMGEFESSIVKELLDESLSKVYMRYVNDTLLLVKNKDLKITIA